MTLYTLHFPREKLYRDTNLANLIQEDCPHSERKVAIRSLMVKENGRQAMLFGRDALFFAWPLLDSACAAELWSANEYRKFLLFFNELWHGRQRSGLRKRGHRRN